MRSAYQHTFWGISALVLLAGVCAVHGQNLIVNPGFENGKAPWEGQIGSVTTDSPHSGAKAYRIVSTKNNFWKIEQKNIAVQPNCAYNAEMWVKTKDIADRVMFLVELYRPDGVRLCSYWDNTIGGTNPYTKLQTGNQLFIPSYCSHVTIRLFLWKCTGTAWVDDAKISLREIESNPPWCRITSPADGAVFPVGSDIVLEADAWDEDGIQNVHFLYTDHWLDKDYSAPYKDTLVNAAAGTYAFKAVMTDTTGRKCVSDVVHVTVSDSAATPAIAVSTTSIATSCEQGQNAPSRTFQVWNSGSGTLAYQVTEGSSLLSVSPATGSSTGTGDTTTHTVSFSTSALAVGTHQRTITVEDNGSGATNTKTITVTITVTAPALPPAAPSGLVATAQSTSAILVTWQDNSGSEEAYKLDRRTSGTTSWTRIVQTAANDTSHTDIGLSAATKYYYQVKAWKADGGNSAYSNIDDATTEPDVQPAIAVSTTSIATSCEQGQNAPSRTFDVWNGGTGTLAYNVLTPSSKLDAGPSAGTSTGSGDKLTHTVTFTTADLDPGTYDRLITIEDNGSGALNSPVTIDVQITVTAPAPDTAIAKGTTWRYRHGSAEASAPAAAWRRVGFDDAGWATGAAPLGYGGAAYGTDLGAMKGDHVSVFLRKNFTLDDPALVEQIAIDVDYDDGFILWLNGQELARINVAGSTGEPVPYDQAASEYVSAASANWTAVLQGGALPPLGTDNVLAVQVMNIGPNSGDLMMDVELSLVTSHLSLAEDADENNLPDDWSQAWLSELSDPSELSDSADPDGDGVSNYGEWVCGTDPGSETGNWKLETRLNAGQLEVRFQALVAAGAGYDGRVRHYTLETQTEGPAGTWTKVPGYEDIVAATDQTIACQPAATGNPAVYRARCWLE